MLVVRGTKKLRDRLKKAAVAGPEDRSTPELGDWFAHALFWRPQVALLVNGRTLLPVFMELAVEGNVRCRSGSRSGFPSLPARLTSDNVVSEGGLELLRRWCWRVASSAVQVP